MAKNINIITEIPPIIPEGSILVTNDYNWRAEDVVASGPRLTSRIVGGRVDHRQLIFMSGFSEDSGFRLCKEYEVPTFIVTFTLDYAEPFMIRVEREAGLYELPTARELGFTLPSTHTFQAWSYLGEDITSIIIEENIVIEGRVERAPNPNLLRGTRTWNSITTNTTPNPPVDIRRNSQTKLVDMGDYTELQMDFDSTTQHQLTFSPTVEILPQGRTFAVLSFIARRVSGIDDLIFQSYPNIGSGPYRNQSVYIDGVLIRTGTGGTGSGSGLVSFSIPDDFDPHVVEIVLTTENAISKRTSWGFVFKSSTSRRVAVAGFSLVKYEQNLGASEEEQRATAWIPHVDDPQ